MGMDLVEIVVEVEERFGLKMTSDDWQSLGQRATVQDLADWIWEHLPAERKAEDTVTSSQNSPAPPPDRIAYQSLEAAALAWLQSRLRQIFPGDELPASVFPTDLSLTQLPGKPSMRWLYEQLRTSGIRLPPLFPSGTQTAIAITIGIVAAACGFAVRWRAGPLNAFEQIIATAVPGCLAWAAVQLLIRHFLAETSTADTIGELAGQLLARNPYFFSEAAEIRLTRAQLNQIVMQILIETLAVDQDEIHLGAQLIVHLGMD